MIKKTLLGILIIVIGVLAWAPWMANNESQKAIFTVARLTKDGERCQEQLWSASWAPFGRWIHHCGKKWYLGFWNF